MFVTLGLASFKTNYFLQQKRFTFLFNELSHFTLICSDFILIFLKIHLNTSDYDDEDITV